MIIVYYDGPVTVVDGRHFISENGGVLDAGGATLAVDRLALMLVNSPVQQVLFLLNATTRESAPMDVTALASQVTDTRGLLGEVSGDRLWCIAGLRTTDNSEPESFIEGLINSFGNVRAGQRQQFIQPSDLVHRMNILAGSVARQSVDYGTGDSTGIPMFFPNAGYDPALPEGIDLETQLRTRERDLREHFGPRSRGVEFESEPGWFFTGRDRVMQELVGWLTTSDGNFQARVITGSPGCGKSAVLARLVTLSHPDYRTKVPLTDASADTVPPAASVDVAIHARNKQLSDIFDSIAAAAGVEAVDVADLVQALSERLTPLVVLVDALDEAGSGSSSQAYGRNEAQRIARQLLRPLSGMPGVKLIVGTRPEMVNALGPATLVTVIDHAQYVQVSDLAQYVYQILRAGGDRARPTPFQDEPGIARTVAAAVAARAYPNFLVARIVARNVLASDKPIDRYASPDWVADFPNEVGEAFKEYLQRFGNEEWRVRRLLAPLVYAEGAGMPWDNLWAPLATAISGEFCSDNDIEWVLESAAAYIVESAADGRSVYRLHHQALVDSLRRLRREMEIQRRITRTLIGQTDLFDQSTARNWFSAHPYIRTHLATHAAAAALIDQLLVDPAYLLAAEPSRLLHATGAAISPDAIDAAQAYQLAYNDLLTKPHSEGIGYLEMAARRTRADGLARRVVASGLVGSWRVPWAAWQISGLYRHLGSHQGGARDIAIGVVNGRTVAVSAGWDKMLRVLDVADGGQLCECVGHEDGVRAVALLKVGAELVAASGSADGTMRLWAVATGAPIGEPRVAHRGDIRAVTSGQFQGGPVVVTGGNDGLIKIWPVGTPQQPARTIGDHGAWVNCLAIFEVEGRMVVASGGDDNAVRLWDVREGRPYGIPLVGHEAGVYGLTVFSRSGRTIIVTGSWDMTMRMWDAVLCQQIRKPILGHDGPVMTITNLEVDGVSLIASGGWDKSIRFWDAGTGESAGLPLRGHDDGVMSLAPCVLDGKSMVVSAGWDNTVRVWDPGSGQRHRRKAVGHSGEVHAIAITDTIEERVVVSAGTDDTIRLWNSDDGRPIAAVRTSQQGPVAKLVAARPTDPWVCATGGWDGRIHLWEHRPEAMLASLFAKAPTSVSSMTMRGLPDGLLVVAGCADNVIYAWRRDGHLHAAALGHDDWVTGVAAVNWLGRDVVVSSSLDHTVRMWDVAEGTLIGDPIAVADSPIRASTVGAYPGYPAITYGCEDGTVNTVGRADDRVETIARHDAAVNAVALGSIGGVPTIASVGEDHILRVRAGPLAHDIDVGCGALNVTFIRSGYLVVSTRLGIVCFDFNVTPFNRRRTDMP